MVHFRNFRSSAGEGSFRSFTGSKRGVTFAILPSVFRTAARGCAVHLHLAPRVQTPKVARLRQKATSYFASIPPHLISPLSSGSPRPSTKQSTCMHGGHAQKKAGASQRKRMCVLRHCKRRVICVVNEGNLSAYTGFYIRSHPYWLLH